MKMRSKYINKVYELMNRMRFMGWECCMLFILSFLHYFITSCSSELEDPEEEKGVFIRVMGYENDYVEVDAVTRATVSWQPAGYKEEHVYTSYGMFFTKEGTAIDTKFRTYNKNWYLVGEVPAGDYYLYGYMPYDAASVTITPPESGNYADGAVMTFRKMNAAMTQDPCIVTAAKHATRNKAPEWTAENPKYTYTLGNGQEWLAPGDFKCEIKSGEEANTLFFLFDHLYAALNMRFRIDETYNQLRDICIKRLELESYQEEACTNLMPKLKATVTLTKREDNYTHNTTTSPIVGDIVFSEDDSHEKMDKILIFNKPNATWKTDTDGKNDRLPSLDAQGNKIYVDKTGYIPNSGTENFFKLTTTYDVYDKKGNLIRNDQTAVNVLNPKKLFNQPRLLRGYRYTLRLTIAPTYLYVMSDDDLEFNIDIEK